MDIENLYGPGRLSIEIGSMLVRVRLCIIEIERITEQAQRFRKIENMI